MQRLKTFSGQISDSENYEGIGIPPKIRINSTTTIIPAIINGISIRKIASITTAMSAIINKVTEDPWNGSNSTDKERFLHFIYIHVSIKKLAGSIWEIPNASTGHTLISTYMKL